MPRRTSAKKSRLSPEITRTDEEFTQKSSNRFPENQDQEYYDDLDVHRIREKAYQIYQHRGGSDVDNWLQAERELRKEQGVKA